MGQAKQRGTFEQRKEKAVIKKEAPEVVEVKKEQVLIVGGANPLREELTHALAGHKIDFMTMDEFYHES